MTAPYSAQDPKREARVGDVVTIAWPDCEKSSFFKNGTRARLVRIDSDGQSWACFDGMGNPPGSFNASCDAEWCIGDPGTHFILAEPAPTELSRLKAANAELVGALRGLYDALGDHRLQFNRGDKTDLAFISAESVLAKHGGAV